MKENDWISVTKGIAKYLATTSNIQEIPTLEEIEDMADVTYRHIFIPLMEFIADVEGQTFFKDSDAVHNLIEELELEDHFDEVFCDTLIQQYNISE